MILLSISAHPSSPPEGHVRFIIAPKVLHGMSKINQIPPILLARAVGLYICGRVHFPKDCIGDIEQGVDETFEVFRKVILKPTKSQPERPGAIFIVRFRFTKFGTKTNRYLSLIPIPFIVAQQGFRSKTWMIGQKTGIFQGFYEWDAIEDARMYWMSFPMKLMKRRAVAESLNHEIKGV